jgi:AcrR family transcriptional regulator
VREEKHAGNRAAIERAALRLFVEQGFDAVTVEAIAESAGVSRATVFRYYGTKEAIVFANHPRELQALQELLEQHQAARQSATALREVLLCFADVLEEEGPSFRQRARVVGSNDRLVTIAQGTRGHWARLLADWMAAGDPPSVRQEIVGALSIEALLIGVRRWHRSAGDERLRSFVEGVFDEMVRVVEELASSQRT